MKALRILLAIIAWLAIGIGVVRLDAYLYLEDYIVEPANSYRAVGVIFWPLVIFDRATSWSVETLGELTR